ncbi:pentatricopeptide repeat-containing protein At2g42920, chloroplastic [Telopea speciosissima]|uniref:pentatricopeptide repeat-containing protein At2g42920, chloroplastic n=1 Tax=Telopea speciosissima TaxID=54955 RepID=UPI001CC4CF02|nr:pentatricopeptide repeat-containing protein At2g42920, chloroplastic [Telopea speciosissima]
MLPCCIALPSPSSCISSFIFDHPSLSMLEKRCTTMSHLHMLHAHLIKTGLAKHTIAASRVLSFCASSPAGDIDYAHLVFSQIQHPNLFAWNTIIRGFSQSSTPQFAISLFIEMLEFSPIEPHRLTYPSLFKAYAQMGLAHDGAQLHGRTLKLGLQSDPFIRNTIIFMYANCGHLIEAFRLFDEGSSFDVVAWNSMIMGLAKSGQVEESRRLFDKMPMRSRVSWNSMISGYVRNGRLKEALDLFHLMQKERIKPDEFTLVSLLSACSGLGALGIGEWVHAYIEKNKINVNTIVSTAIVDMYCKCGSVDKALRVFETIPNKGLSCWNSMILGLAMNGRGKEAIQLFSRLQSSDLRPDDVSFLGVLTACNHSGLVSEAKEFFFLMTETYKIKPTIKHYGCMVDVLGRAGLLNEAEELIGKIPLNSDAIIWSSLLSACRIHGNIEMGKRAAKTLIELDSTDSGSYILLSNVYTTAGQFTDAVNTRQSMKEKHIRREPGCSLIEVNGVVYEFIAGGRLHPQAREIYSLLVGLSSNLRELGHVEHGALDVIDSQCQQVSV